MPRVPDDVGESTWDSRYRGRIERGKASSVSARGPYRLYRYERMANMAQSACLAVGGGAGGIPAGSRGASGRGTAVGRVGWSAGVAGRRRRGAVASTAPLSRQTGVRREKATTDSSITHSLPSDSSDALGLHMTVHHQLLICTSCRRPGRGRHDDRPGALLFEGLSARFKGWARREHVVIAAVDCLSACSNACAAALQSPGKFTWVFGRLEPGRDEAALVEGVTQFCRTATGFIPHRDLPSALRGHLVARIPPAEKS